MRTRPLSVSEKMMPPFEVAARPQSPFRDAEVAWPPSPPNPAPQLPPPAMVCMMSPTAHDGDGDGVVGAVGELEAVAVGVALRPDTSTATAATRRARSCSGARCE